jgi:DNA-binding transcriptional LysR family regulator
MPAQIRSPEENAGESLFDRINRKATLTPVGVTLLRYVRTIDAIANESMIPIVSFCIRR